MKQPRIEFNILDWHFGFRVFNFAACGGHYRPLILLVSVLGFACIISGGCGMGGLKGYSNTWLYPDDVQSVYVEMFDTQSFRRGHEYVLTDAICKRIESETPYKIVSDRDLADTLLSGQLSIGQGFLARDRYTGRALELEALATVSVSWKNLTTGELLVNNEVVVASASYSSQLGQDYDYASRVAVNRAAEKVVELMERDW